MHGCGQLFFLRGEMCNRRDNAGYHFWLPWLQFIGDVYSIGHTSNPATLAVSHVSLPRCWCPSLAKEPHVQDLNGGHVRAPRLWCPVAGYRHRCGPSRKAGIARGCCRSLVKQRTFCNAEVVCVFFVGCLWANTSFLCLDVYRFIA